LWVIATLAGLVVLITFVLCVPIDTSFILNTAESPRFRIRLIWLFGLISKELGRKEKKPRKKKKPEEKPKKKRRIEFGTILKILRTKGLLRQIRNLVKGIFGRFRIREMVADIRLGLDDPADTAILFALIGAARPFINLPSKYRIGLQPYFHDEVVFEGYIRGVLRLQPIWLVCPVLRFMFSLAVLRVMKILVLSRWRRKK
jgi:hypothetical protein